MKKRMTFCNGDVVFHKTTKRLGWVRTGNVGNPKRCLIDVCFSNSPKSKAETMPVKNLVKRNPKVIIPKMSDIGREVELHWIDSPNDIALITDVDLETKSIYVAGASSWVPHIGFDQIVRLGPRHKFQLKPSKTVGPLLKA